MPKPLSPEQLTELQANGVAIPGYGSPETSSESPAIPAGLIERTLGSTGLPHTVSIERMGENTDTPASIEPINPLGLRESYQANHATVSAIMATAGEAAPDVLDRSLLLELEELEPIFSIFEARGLAPEVVLYPANRPLKFWVDLAQAVQDSPLNPDELDPDRAGHTRKVLRDGGLWVSKEVKARWALNTNSFSEEPRWKLEVISGLERPSITSVTSYGYEDTENSTPSEELNELLDDLDLEIVPARTDSDPLNQPDIHPTADGYLMHQLTRITQQKAPLDIQTNSCLRSILASNYLPIGYWSPEYGKIRLGWDYACNLGVGLGVRPSVRGWFFDA